MTKEIYQQIANSHVQQVMAQKREQELAALQADFAAFQEQQKNPEALMADFNSFMESQQPVKQATVNEIKEIPKLRNQIDLEDFFTPKTANGENINKREASKEDLTKARIADIARKIDGNIIPTEEQFNLNKAVEEAKTGRRTTAYKESVKDVVNALNSKEVKEANALADYNKTTAEKAQVDQWLSPDYKLTDKDKEAAKKYAQEELQKFNYGSNRQPLLKSDEDRQHYADMVNLLNKTNTLTNAMTGVIKQPAALGRAVRDAGNSIIDQLTGLGAAIGDKAGLTEGATQRHNERVTAREAFNKQNDESMIQSLANAHTQNPHATTAGEIGGQVAMYALTNPLFDSLGAAAGLGKAGSFALNQVGQNAQDLALDTIPMLNDYLEGGVSDEEKKELWKNVGLNAAGNLAIGAAGEGISALAKNRAARKAADEAFRVNALEGADKLAKLAGTEDIDNIVRSATRQAEEAAQNIESLNKTVKAIQADNVNTAPEIINAGKATYIKDFYKGQKPNKLSTATSVTIGDDAYNRAISGIEDARNSDRSFSSKAREYVKNIFDSKFKNKPARKVVLNNVDFDGNDYVVEIDYDALKESISKGHISPEKLSTYEMLDDILANAEYVDSGTSMYHGTKPKDNIVRYDYFETPVTINGKNYIATCDVEVKTDGKNKYKLHKVVNEINLVPVTEQGLNDVGTTAPIKGFTDGIAVNPDLNTGATTQLSNLNVTDAIDNVNKKSVNPLENISEDDIKLSDAEINNLLAKMEPASISKAFDPEVEEKILSDFDEIYRSMDSMNQAAIDSGDAKIIEKFEKLQKAVFDYEEKIWKSGDAEEITKAKKAADAARQGFIRQMKKIDPNYKGDLTGTKLGNAEFRIPKVLSDAEADELVNGWVKEDLENPNRFLRSANERSNVPGANPLQTFADKRVNDQLTELEKRRQQAMLDINEQARQAVLNENPEVARFSDPESDLRRLASERAYREEQLNKLKTPEEKEDEALDALTNYVNSQRQTPPPGGNGPTRNTVEDVARNMPEGQRSNIPPSPPTGNNLAPEDQWKTSKWRTNTAENQGWGDNLPMKDYAYRVFTEAEQRAAAVERYSDIENVYSELMHTDQFDEIDVKMAMSEMQRLMDEGTPESLRQARMLGSRTAAQGRESGRAVQAFAEYNRNTASGALTDASKAQDDLIIEPWKSKNKKKVEGNSRIAKALSDMGNKWRGNKVKPELTHEQIKQGVKAEIEREMGSIEGLLNDNDLEFLTMMAEDKSIPVWQITDEIEHRLNTGTWYTLDEAIEPPKKLNTKLNNALKSLIETDAVRPEAVKPDLKQITEEVRNTLGKESADFEGLFDDNDINYIANMINNGASKEELAEALNLKMATGDFGISDETLQQVNDIFKQISRFDPDSKQFVEGQAEAYRLLANEILPNATPLEKFEAWRYVAMLGNPKTMIRNYVGNKMFGAVTGISNNLAALGEAGVDKAVKAMGGEGIQRSKAILNPVKDMPLIKAATEDADASSYRQIMGSKYEKFSKDSFRKYKSVFNTKLAQLYEKVTDAGISDYSAVKKKYSTSLAGYLKANGFDTDVFKAEDELARLKNLGETRLLSDAENARIDKLTQDIDVLEKAREYAIKQAEYATFHEDNAFAKWLTKTSNDAPGPLRAMIEGVVPFKKTPANVLKSGLQYSPLGAVDSIKKTGKLIYENTGKRAGNLADTYINSKGKEVAKTLANDVIESWSKTLTGSALTALGFYLFDKGILLDSDKETKYQDQLEGLQNYSIKIGNKTYTVDWAAPAVMPLLLGAEVAKVWNSEGNEVENWYEHLDEYLNAANRIADPIIETSMLSGVKDTLETAANAAKYDENLNIPTLIGYNTLTGYLTQAIPTASGQIARTVDNTRRSAYTDKEGVAGTLEKQGRKLMNKIPGLTTFNQPYVDTYGREQRNSPSDNPLFNLAYQMVSPGYLTDINTTDADTISREVFEKSGKAENVLPQWKSTFKFDGKRVSPEDYTKGAKVYGEAQKEIRDTLANDEWYNGLTPEEQTDIMNDINTLSEHAAKAAIDPEYATSSKPYTAYKEGGISGLMDYYKGQQAKNVAKESGLSSSSNASKAIQADVQAGNMEAAQEKVDAATYLKNNGLTKPGPSFTYYNAQDQIPSLTPEEFTKTYKAIDTNSNQGITQDELIAYLNKTNVSESEGKKLWSAYGSTKWKAIPKLDGGTWKKSK